MPAPATGWTARRRATAALAALSLGAAFGTAPAGAAGEVFVNTTEDLPFEANLCLPGRPCSLRAAIARSEGRGGTVRACYDPAEVGGTKRCPPGWAPLTHADPGYDPARKKWVFRIGDDRAPIEIATDDNVLDFTRDIDGWDGPEDNRIVLDSGNNLDLNQAISVELGTGNTFMGLEVTGTYVLAAIDVLDGAHENQFGPGLILSGLGAGAGLRFYGPDVHGNRIVGSWCGLTGDGTQISPVADDCVQFDDRSHDNVVGGPEPADRNVLGGSRLGVGVAVAGGGIGNAVEGNWIGLDARGEPTDTNLGGVRVAQEAHGSRVVGNVVSGNRGPGISIADATRDVLVEGNRIGLLPGEDAPAPNAEYAVRIVGLPKGSTVRANHAAYNGAGGLYVSGANTYDNTFIENRLSNNDGPALQVLQGANRGVRPPQITYATTVLASGTACAGCRVEVFSDPADEADVFEGAVEAGADGRFELSRPEGFRYRNLTATATQGRNTSSLAAPVVVGNPGPTPTTGPTLPAPTEDPDALVSVYLPWLAHGALRR
jgi:hypothetical protein